MACDARTYFASEAKEALYNLVPTTTKAELHALIPGPAA